MGRLLYSAGGDGDIRYDGRRFALYGNASELRRDFGLRVFEKVFDASAADISTEELRCQIGNLMCLVEDDRVRGPRMSPKPSSFRARSASSRW